VTQSRRRALWTIAIWGVVAIGFAITFFSGGGPARYADDGARQLAGAAFLGIGFLGTPLMMFQTRVGAGAEHVVRDERDESIGRRAAVGGLVVVLIYVFLACIVLWERHRDPGCVPVGWMWFLAYSTAALAYLVPAIVSVLLDSGGGSRAEG
jgi:uncharacterized membrane protein